MSEIEPPVSFLPTGDDPLTDLDALRALENRLQGRPGEIDLIIGPDPDAQQPIGRSWAFDFHNDGFVKEGALSPLPTTGLETLKGWIEKCLNTARGAHPVHPPGYGVVKGVTDLISSNVGAVPADLYERIEDALTFHPRISSVSSFTYTYDELDEAVAIDFVVVLDDDTEIPFNRLGLSL